MAQFSLAAGHFASRESLEKYHVMNKIMWGGARFGAMVWKIRCCKYEYD